MLWSELLDKSDDELDALCAQAQDDADRLPDGVERERLESLAEATAGILEDRHGAPVFYVWQPVEELWSLLPVQ